jgi:hypothetical protein
MNLIIQCESPRTRLALLLKHLPRPRGKPGPPVFLARRRPDLSNRIERLSSGNASRAGARTSSSHHRRKDSSAHPRSSREASGLHALNLRHDRKATLARLRSAGTTGRVTPTATTQTTWPLYACCSLEVFLTVKPGHHADTRQRRIAHEFALQVLQITFNHWISVPSGRPGGKRELTFRHIRAL